MTREIDDFDLALPKTRLGWKDEVLMRYTKEGNKLAEFRAEDIQDITIIHPIDLYVIFFGIVSAIVSILSFLKVQHAGLCWTLTIVFGLICVVVHKKNQINIVTSDGNFPFDLAETTEDSAAFASTVRHKIKEIAANQTVDTNSE